MRRLLFAVAALLLAFSAKPKKAYADGWAAGTATSLFSSVLSFTRMPPSADCERDSSVQRTLERHVGLAQTIGVAGTPTFVSRRGMLGEPPTTAGLLRFAERK